MLFPKEPSKWPKQVTIKKPIKEYKSEKNIGRALEEVYDGLIHIEKR